MRLSFRSLTLGLASALAGLFPLQAQVDSRFASAYDVLDVYTKAGTSARPEMLTVFDLSRSMLAVAWSPYYKGSTRGTYNPHSPAWGQSGDSDGLVPVIVRVATQTGANSYLYTYEVAFAKGTGWPEKGATLGTTTILDVSSVGSLVNANNALVNISGSLVKRDGTVVTFGTSKLERENLADILLNTSSTSNPVTHIRVARLLDSSSTSPTTRTVDVPIPWKIFDSPSSAVASPSVNANVQVSSIKDIYQTSLDVPFDTIHEDGLSNSVGYTLTGYASNSSRYQTIVQDDDVFYGNNNTTWQTSTGSGIGSVTRTYFKVGLFHYNADYLWWILFGSDQRNPVDNSSTTISGYVIPDASTSPAWSNGLPALTRMQALKSAVIMTLVPNQDKLWWGVRFLDYDGENGLTTFSDANSSGGALSSPVPASKITVLNPNGRVASNSTTLKPELKNGLSGKFPYTSHTPLTYAFANSYAQMTITNSSSEFSGSKTESPIPKCRKSFVVVFTDGAYDDSNSSGTSNVGSANPFWDAKSAVTGDTTLWSAGSSSYGKLLPGQNSFNVWTLSGVAAQGDKSTSNASSTFAPYLITSRPSGTTRRVTTMTVGLSLAGTLDYNTPANNASLTGEAATKWGMYQAALYGNRRRRDWSGSTLPLPFNSSNTAKDPDRNPFYFDTQNLTDLQAALDAIVTEVLRVSSTLSAPSTPLVGLSLGRQVYLGTFQTSDQAIWKGDLLMTQLEITSTGATTFINRSGQSDSTVASNDAVWSAAETLAAKGWANRNLITYNGSSVVGIRSVSHTVYGVADDTARDNLVNWLKGSIDGSSSGIARTTLMGDIINSSPITLEFDKGFLSGSGSISSSALTTFYGNLTAAQKELAHFRLIFVESNHGQLHCFGEVSYLDSSLANTNAPKGRIVAAVDELWSFVLPDLLPSLPAWRTGGSHIYLADGSPSLYFKDVPASGASRGDGFVTKSGTDVAYVVFGQGKGGRNYYCLNIANPESPSLVWRLNPALPNDTTVSGTAASLKLMGLATSSPAIGRIVSGTTSSSGTPISDWVFIGGGHSTAGIDANWGTSTLGRFVVGFPIDSSNPAGDANTTIWSIAGTTGSGSVGASVVPMEVIPNSNLTQRVYFTDRNQGLWVIGKNTKSSGIFVDSSKPSDWSSTPRALYKTQTNRFVSHAPVPFRLASTLASYSSAATNKVKLSGAIGVVIGTGDRYDPIDRDSRSPYTAAGAVSTTGEGYNQLAVVFDRFDDPIGGVATDTNLTDLTTNASTDTTTVSTPSDSGYYLTDAGTSSKIGYYLRYEKGMANSGNPSGDTYFYPKTVNAPALVAGVLFFSVFDPKAPTTSSDLESIDCGTVTKTKTYRICNILKPAFAGNTDGGSNATASATSFDASADLSTVSGNCSGAISTFSFLAGEITALGTASVLQGGVLTDSSGNPISSGDVVGTSLSGFVGNQQRKGIRPKSWRIVR